MYDKYIYSVHIKRTSEGFGLVFYWKARLENKTLQMFIEKKKMKREKKDILSERNQM